MKHQINQGIQGTNLKIAAQAIAVGKNAQAVSTSREPADRAELERAIARLLAAIDQLKVTPAVQQIVKEDAVQLAAAAKDPKSSSDRLDGLMKGMAAKLAAFGIVLKEATGLAEPLKKIAEIVQVSVAGLGL